MITVEHIDVHNHPGFKATKNGQIIGKRGKPLKGHIDRCGYKEVILSENGTSKSYLVHRSKQSSTSES